MQTIQELYQTLFSKDKTLNPREFIELYEANENLIEQEEHSTAHPSFDEIVEIISDYGIYLFQTGSLTKAIPYLNKAIRLYHYYPKEKQQSSYKLEVLHWTRGAGYYTLKDYKKSKKDFQFLVDLHPDNDKYKNWLIGTKTARIKGYVNYLWIMAAVLWVWNIFMNNESELKETVLMLAIIMMILAVAGEVWKYLIKKKING